LGLVEVEVVEVIFVASKNTDSGAIPDVRLTKFEETGGKTGITGGEITLPVELISVVEPDFPPQETKKRDASRIAQYFLKFICKIKHQ